MDCIWCSEYEGRPPQAVTWLEYTGELSGLFTKPAPVCAGCRDKALKPRTDGRIVYREVPYAEVCADWASKTTQMVGHLDSAYYHEGGLSPAPLS